MCTLIFRKVNEKVRLFALKIFSFLPAIHFLFCPSSEFRVKSNYARALELNKDEYFLRNFGSWCYKKKSHILLSLLVCQARYPLSLPTNRLTKFMQSRYIYRFCHRGRKSHQNIIKQLLLCNFKKFYLLAAIFSPDRIWFSIWKLKKTSCSLEDEPFVGADLIFLWKKEMSN